MNLKQRASAFAQLGTFIERHYSGERLASEVALHEGLEKLIEVAGTYNNWFIPKFVNEAILNIGRMLNRQDLERFSEGIKERPEKTVAVICAGNIPMVGFHDLLCILLCGHKALLRLSTDDNVLLPFFLKLLVHYEPGFEERIIYAERKLSGFDAIIATGSDNTATHLHYYFGKYPHIIRHNRTSLAVLNGKETNEELLKLGADIFTYFGLGCRNVSKLLVPDGYSFHSFFPSMVDFGFVINNKKYGNNYDYHRAIYLLERMEFLDNNFLMVRESPDLFSPVGVLYYQNYSGPGDVQTYIETNMDRIQCVVGAGYTPFGYSQRPVITEFADNVNTVQFLVNL